MSKWSRADDNQQVIVEALRRAGWLVISLTKVGGGCPDLLLARAGEVLLVEVKMPAGKLSKEQAAMALAGLPFKVVRSVDDALKL